MWAQLCDTHGRGKSHTMPYHPANNAKLCKGNGELDLLGIFGTDRGQHWVTKEPDTKVRFKIMYYKSLRIVQIIQYAKKQTNKQKNSFKMKINYLKIARLHSLKIKLKGIQL